jgi:hypothetical protein
MALINAYADPNVNADFITMATRSRNIRQGKDPQIIRSGYSVSGTDNVASVYRMFKNIDANFVPTRILLASTAMAALSVQFGIYNANGSLNDAPLGTGKAIFQAATVIAAGASSLKESIAFNFMATYEAAVALDPVLMEQRLFEIAGDSLVESGSAAPNLGNPRQYDLCLTVSVTTAVAGKIFMELHGYMG